MARAAAVTLRFQLQGVDDLLRRLAALPRGLRNRVLRRALRRGSQPVVQAARRLVPADTRELRRSIGTRSRTYRRGGVIVFVIGPRWGARTKAPRGRRARAYNPGRYGHLVELGTGPHLIPITRGPFAGRVARHPGSRPRPFMRRGFGASRRRAEAIIVADIRLGIDNIARTGKP